MEINYAKLKTRTSKDPDIFILSILFTGTEAEIDETVEKFIDAIRCGNSPEQSARIEHNSLPASGPANL